MRTAWIWLCVFLAAALPLLSAAEEAVPAERIVFAEELAGASADSPWRFAFGGHTWIPAGSDRAGALSNCRYEKNDE